MLVSFPLRIVSLLRMEGIKEKRKEKRRKKKEERRKKKETHCSMIAIV
jgi:hypothetical protein